MKLFSLIMSLMAIVTGGAYGMAVTVGKEGGATDPNANTPLQGAVEDDPNKGIQQPGQGATASALQEAELIDNKVNEFVEKFQAHRYPFHTDIMSRAKQIQVNSPEPTYFEVGEARLEAVTSAPLSADTSSATAVLPVATMDKRIFPENSLVLVAGVEGCIAGTTNKDGSPLVLYVESNNATGVTVSALNGPTSNGIMSVPEIPAGTELFVMAPALSESEVEMAPDNAMPQEGKVYLQKKCTAMTWTEMFEKIKKEAEWSLSDIDDYRMNIFRKKCTRAHLIGKAKKFYKEGGKHTGVECVYTEEGVLRQLRLGYQLSDGQINYEDLIAICAMMFGRYDTPNVLTAYCGTKFIQRLLAVDFKDRREVTIRQYTDETTKIVRTSFECNFGKIEFVHEFALDDIGYSECCFICDIDNAKRLYIEKGKTITIDHSKGEGGEVREAKSSYYLQNDCLKLSGFNSMFVGPSNLVGGYKLSALEAMITSVNELPAANAENEGNIVYLIADTDANPMGLYICKKGSGSAYAWEPYNGKEIHV